MSWTRTLLPLAAGLTATPALAELPDSTRAMIEAAIAKGDPDKVATVIDLAREVHPEDAAELDAIAAQFASQQQALAAEEAAAEEEAIREAGLFDNWTGEGQIGAFRSTGNSSNTGITAGLKLARLGIDWRHKLRGLVDYQRSNGITTREQFLAAYEVNYDLSGDLYAYALAQYERDRFQGFSARYSASGGLGYRVIENESMNLEVKAGPAWRRTERTNGTSSTRIAGLLAADFDWQIADTIAFTQDASAFVQSDNSTFIATTGLEAGLTDAIKARISYTVEHDTDPPPGAIKTDTLTRFTLIYGF
ncbi:DUF481 domain-containing protein [Erythrobacter litoralis]|uniref:Putative salt-induced outer membrane protein n=1 Tax=Erythrobacter litoralis (strain HTCC2594) TaxID=314225 RepID=Q2NBZ0_ERYLH|nr:DUF481 domain-containing protein [Erythrobacter litoralis]ABC62801.1 putative salt-induced outer membrane protein [Erythrobacter litoralis HTCC2594]